MKYFLPVVFIVFLVSRLTGQNLPENVEGKVSYVTTQNVYAKFKSTENIAKGDTLYAQVEGALIPGLIVQDISSISCVCIPLSGLKLSVGDQVFSKQKAVKSENNRNQNIVSASPVIVASQDSANPKKDQVKKRTQLITGNVSVASYLNFSDVSANSQRMKYTFSMVAQNIGNSKLSAETYITFAHKLNEWSEVQDDIFNGLKIYSLSVNYEFNKNNKIWLGRKINPRISNVGAIDGLQYELKAGSFTIGLVGGTRPDYRNYSFNSSLPQFGAYLGHDLYGKNGSMQTTVAFMDQMNSGSTDRRFAYLQHTNSLIRNLFFFGSVEVDLYNKTMNIATTTQDSIVHQDTTYPQDNSPHLSNLYLSLRYRPIRQISLTLSYSNRQNVIYYETYKDIVDRLLEAATVQGFILQINLQPVKLLTIGLNAGYRNSKNDPRPSKNLYGYLTYSRIPGVNVAATISATILETSYMSGKIFSLGLSRDLVPGKLSSGLSYRYVSYKFYSGETNLVQNMAEVNFSWRILKKLSCGLYYEGTFDPTSIFNRVYINITQRF
ncbi:MAG: hypothetical protein NTW16_03615 [Bacteroidetes bacterium]|nr:hypothetical protein [Bacteroidota bacterium]